MKFDIQDEFPSKKYLIIQEEINEVIAVCYEQSNAISVALALKETTAANFKYEIVTAKGEKHYRSKVEGEDVKQT